MIDAHVYVGESLYGAAYEPQCLLRHMDECGIAQAVLCPARPPTYDLQPANRYVAELVHEYAERFFGLARVDPWQRDTALANLREAREALGLHGLLLHPWEETFQISHRFVDPLVAYAGDEGMPVFVESGYAWLAHVHDVAELARRHPRVTVVGTHGMQLDASAYALVDIKRAMHDNANLLMETSGMYAAEFMEEIVNELGATRLVFGSHSPWFDLYLEVQRVRLMRVNQEQRAAITEGNIRRILRQ